MFGGPSTQQPPSSQGPAGVEATPRGSSLFGSIIPGSNAPKESSGAGFFSMFGGPSTQTPQRGATSGPRGTTPGPPPGPRGAMPGPRGATPGPRGHPPGLRGATPGPRGAAPGPRGHPPGPRGATTGHRGPPPGPIVTTLGPEAAPPGPIVTTSGPEAAPPGPIVTTSGPGAAPPGPIGATPEPEAPPPGPTGARPEPEAPPPGPIGARPEPEAAPSGPTGDTPEPGASPPEPIGATPEPGASPPGPIGDTPEPGASPPGPIGATPEPGSVNDNKVQMCEKEISDDVKDDQLPGVEIIPEPKLTTEGKLQTDCDNRDSTMEMSMNVVQCTALSTGKQEETFDVPHPPSTDHVGLEPNEQHGPSEETAKCVTSKTEDVRDMEDKDKTISEISKIADVVSALTPDVIEIAEMEKPQEVNETVEVPERIPDDFNKASGSHVVESAVESETTESKQEKPTYEPITVDVSSPLAGVEQLGKPAEVPLIASVDSETDATRDQTLTEIESNTCSPETNNSAASSVVTAQSKHSDDSVLTPDQEKAVNSQPPAGDPPTGPSRETAGCPPQPQGQGVARLPASQGPRFGGPRMGGPRVGGPRGGGPGIGGPRMAGPRLAGPRPPVPQKSPEPAPFSNFMSMFSTPSAPSKPANTGGFFSSSPGSFFGSAPAQPKQDQKSSLFGLSTGLPTESLTSDLFGMFKGPEATKSSESQPLETQIRQDDHKDKENTDIENACATNPEITQESEVPEKGLIENVAQADKTATAECDSTELVEEEAGHESVGLSKDSEAGPQLAPEPKADVPSAPEPKAEATPTPEPKGMFEIPRLTAPKFGFMSGGAEGASSLGSLFSTNPSPVLAAKTQQPPQSDGGLFSGFKNLSAGIFQEEKPSGNEDPSNSSSVFGMKLGSMFGASDSSKAEGTLQAVTGQPQSPKLADEVGQLETEGMSSGSEETGSADVSDAEEPTESPKTGSALSGFPSLSLEEGIVPSLPEDVLVSSAQVTKEETAVQDTEEFKKEPVQRLV